MVLVNGQSVNQIDVSDRGLHYGDGLFETIAVRDGRPQFWQKHIARLSGGCKRLGIPGPDIAMLGDEADKLCSGLDKAVLKIIITRGSGGRGYRAPSEVAPSRILQIHPWPDYADNTTPFILRLCETQLGCNPALAGIKHLNRLEQVLARNEWNDESIDEGVMCDRDGNVIEGTSSNLFAVREGKLLTPDVRQCGIAGVMRGMVLKLADDLGIPSEIITIHRDEMAQMDELFVTNSILGIRAVARYEEINYEHNPISQRLQDALQKRLETST